jgi:glycosyltransferase involved in cell wall biosynthesis
MLRVRNEERWLHEVLSAMAPCCDHIWLFDDKSTDNTPHIARMFPSVTVLPSPFTGTDEARDKSYMLDIIHENAFVCATHGDFVLALDGDEVLERSGPEKIRRIVDHPGEPYVYSLKFDYAWNDRHTIRCDGVYGRFYRPSLFRLINKAFKFKTTPFGNGANLHCSSIPQELLHHNVQTDIRILHLGYLHAEDRIRKHAWYNSIDPNNEGEDCYRHCVQGDVPEVPADARLKWAGPLTLVPWVE